MSANNSLKIKNNQNQSPYTSKGYPLKKDWSSYNTYDIGRAFFSDGFVNHTYSFSIFDNQNLFIKSVLKDEVLFYKKREIPVTIYSADNENEIINTSKKLVIDYDEIAFFFFKQDENIKAKINLGNSLLKLSNFENENQMKNKTFDISPQEMQKINNNLSAKNIVSFFNKDNFLFKEDVENINGLFNFKNLRKIQKSLNDDFINAWWSKDFEGKIYVNSDIHHSYRSSLEETVYFQITVNDRVKEGTIITFNLFDYDGIFNPDDKKFNNKEIIKKVEVRKVEKEKRITIELYLNPTWENNILEEKGLFSNGYIELYWSWNYNNVLWRSKELQLSVYPSENKLYVRPLIQDSNYKLPEIYSHKGEIILFAIDQLPNGTIKKFVSMKLRNTIKYRSFEDINKFYKEIFTEKINLETNTLETASYQVEELNHYFKIKNNAQSIFIEEENIDVPVEKGSKQAVYNSLFKGVKMIKNAAEVYNYYDIFKQTINMFPELSDNGKLNAPSLSTFVGLIPSANIYAFALALTEWSMKAQKEQDDIIIDQSLWVKWQNKKKQGLDAALNFVDYNGWASDKTFRKHFVSQETLDALFKGTFKTIDELNDFNNIQKAENKYVLISYRMNKEELDTFVDVIDCIYFKS
ncbi:hypothetical protein [Flavobacterium dankookense]|uniref:Uncharacterized protein n=1 Tax=Flavobacterium dankookense TaxID=706186 RepID=A0A4R6QDW6_9FLAO|nr:hypothetical protein [Flavobacterium dankookense]TDP60083.1 hypothetical protein BC748_1056 [Flavobacterium dankookense]